MTTRGAFPSCDHTVGCITCGDEAVSMRVLRFDGRRQLALCEADGRSGTVDTLLVGPVRPGERLLVHAGVALQRDRAAEGPVEQ
jgi:hydrogenase maturation factor